MTNSNILSEKLGEVETTLDNLFQTAKRNEYYRNDYVIFLANGTKQQDLAKAGRNPFAIDYMGNIYDDVARQNFYVSYLNQNPYEKYEQFKEGKEKDDYFFFCTTLEMMIYSHVWESNWILKILKQLAGLVTNKPYDWEVESKIPNDGRSKFIREQIRLVFEGAGLSDMNDLLLKSYHSQIRNAFAHSDFSFGTPVNKERIYLLNFSNDPKKPWEKRSIEYEEWDSRFAYTVLLGHYLLLKIKKERLRLGAEGFTKFYEIMHPITNDGKTLSRQLIEYNLEHDRFHFSKITL